MEKDNKSLLILGKGDKEYNDRNAARLFTYANKVDFDVIKSDYSEINLIKGFRNETIYVMLFFPYSFWNEHCEIPSDNLLYGTSKMVYEMFNNFFLDVKHQLEQKFSNHYQLKYIINPETAALDRDKVATLNLLKANNVPTTDIITSRNLIDLLNDITPEKGIFIKCRYGAEGKGITLLKHNKWVTNYKVKNIAGNAYLVNYGVYDKWIFSDITERVDLLEQLLDQEVIVEKEIISPDIFPNEKFDIRAYSIDGKVPHFFARINNKNNVVTNFSQGARIMHSPHIGLSREYIDAAMDIAVKASNALKSTFIGIDLMFDGSPDKIKVVEAQTFTDFPDIRYFDLAKYLITDSFAKQNSLQ
ncbi:hypothetical protein HZA96_03015 [Candidatus Woesearchaeota archaeon]|nr:hypothetical protein [Candidatus Woesearchaeota archaeon]